LGHEDVNDHDYLCHDLALKFLANPNQNTPKTPSALAGKSTLNRLEHSWEIVDRRYHQFSLYLKKLNALFVVIIFFWPNFTSVILMAHKVRTMSYVASYRASTNASLM